MLNIQPGRSNVNSVPLFILKMLVASYTLPGLNGGENYIRVNLDDGRVQNGTPATPNISSVKSDVF